MSHFSQTMTDRWLRASHLLPNVDKTDICKEVPSVNGGTVKPLESRRQHHAEFTQTSYLRLRQQEESYLMYNYLDPEANKPFKDYLSSMVGDNMSFS